MRVVRVPVESSERPRIEVAVLGGEGLPSQLWFLPTRDLAGSGCSVGNAALLALLLPAMRQSTDLRLDLPVSSALLESVAGPLQSILLVAYPRILNRVSITTDARATERPPLSGSTTGFSGGVDSFYTIESFHLRQNVSDERKIRGVMLGNVGGFGFVDASQSRFRERLISNSRIAGEMGLDVLGIDSNLDSFYASGTYTASHSLRNAALAHLMDGEVGRYLYSAGTLDSEVVTHSPADIAYIDPIVLPLLSSGTLVTESVGADVNRAEKTSRISHIPQAQRGLDVCVVFPEDRVNCSRCYKCLRTLLTLEILGRLDDFATMFDLDAYWRERPSYVARVLAGSDPFDLQILNLAKDRCFVVDGYDRKELLKSRLRRVARDAYRHAGRPGSELLDSWRARDKY